MTADATGGAHPRSALGPVLLRAHPAFGLLPGDEAPDRTASLPMWWLRLSRSERRARERAYFRELLAEVGGSEDLWFEAKIKDRAARRDLAALPDATERGDSVEGPLTPAAIDALLDAYPNALIVSGSLDVCVEFESSWLDVEVRLEPDHAAELTQRLQPEAPIERPSLGSWMRALAIRSSPVVLFVVVVAITFAIGHAVSGSIWRYLIFPVPFVLAGLIVEGSRFSTYVDRHY